MPTEANIATRASIIDPVRAPADVAGAAEGDGVDDLTLYRLRYTDAASVSGTSDRHLVFVNVGAAIPAQCRIGTAELDHQAEHGNIVVIPAGVAWKASMPLHAEHIVATLPIGRMAVAAAQAAGKTDAVQPHMRSFDPILFSIASEMAQYARPDSADQLAWHALADEFSDQIYASYCAPDARSTRGYLTPESVARLNDFVRHRLGEPLAIDDLADVVAQSRSHFPRLFRRTLGLSPHQYVMRLRLRHARALMRRGCALAEVAVASGFADQSHMTRWIRKIYGTTPGRLTGNPGSAEIF